MPWMMPASARASHITHVGGFFVLGKNRLRAATARMNTAYALRKMPRGSVASSQMPTTMNTSMTGTMMASSRHTMCL